MTRSISSTILFMAVLLLCCGRANLDQSVPDGGTPSTSSDGGFISCGGFAGLSCPPDLRCGDDPRGPACHIAPDADCAGICYAKEHEESRNHFI
jgi:hypothetical protein